MWRENTSGKTEVVCTCAEERWCILGQGCWRWNCQERRTWEGLNVGLWMRWERTWQSLKWRMRMHNTGLNGDGISAESTLDERSRKKKKNHYIGQIEQCRLAICLTNVIGWKRSQLGLLILTNILVRHISTNILVKLTNLYWLFVWPMWLVGSDRST